MSMGGGGGGTTVKPPQYLNDFVYGQVAPRYGDIGSGRLTPAIPDSFPTYIGPNEAQNYGNAQQLNYYSGPQANYLAGSGGNALGQLLNSGFDPRYNTLYGATSGLSPLLQHAFTNILSGGGGGGGGSSGFSTTMGGGPYTPETNADIDALVAATNKDVTDSFNQQTLPGIRSGAMEAGQAGSSREGIAEGVARSNLDTTLARTDQEIRSNANEAERNRQAQLAASRMSAAGAARSAAASERNAALGSQVQALQVLGSLMGQGTNTGFNATTSGLQYFPTGFGAGAAPGQGISGIGNFYQNQGNNQLNADLDRYRYNNSLTLQDLQSISGIINGTNPSAYSRTSTSANPYAQAAGTALAAYGMYSDMGGGAGKG